jgi:transcriptional regulator with XRE-family HTH domain
MVNLAARPLKELLRRARYALEMSQAEFGAALGWSHRTAVRWEQGTAPYGPTLTKLAALLVHVDRDLAVHIAAAAHETLESLGLAGPPTGPRVTQGDLADAVVCAAADATDLPPRALRPLLHAAFARARALGVTVEQIEESLRVRVDPKAQAGKPPVRLRVGSALEQVDLADRDPDPTPSRRARVR